jgi:SAM-dependent methyltransferase
MDRAEEPASGGTVWDRIYAEGGYEKDVDPELIALCGRVPLGRALDVGAGEGRHSLFLAARGWRVDALDISVEGIARLKRRAEAMGVSVNAWAGSAAGQDFAAGAYDLVLSTGAVLNFFEKAAARRLIERLKAAVRPGGWIYLSVCTVGDPAYRRHLAAAKEVREDSFFVEGTGWVTAFRSGELAALFGGWREVACSEREVRDTHTTPHTHAMAFLTARAP